MHRAKVRQRRNGYKKIESVMPYHRKGKGEISKIFTQYIMMYELLWMVDYGISFDSNPFVNHVFQCKKDVYMLLKINEWVIYGVAIHIGIIFAIFPQYDLIY